jgi:hypothetical protein
LEKDRDRRFSNVSQVALALAPFGSRATSRSLERISRILGATGHHDLAPMSGPAPAPGAFGPSTQSSFGQTNNSRSSAAPLVAGLGLAVLLLGGLTAFLILRPKTGNEPVSAASVQPTLAEVLPAPTANPVTVAPLPESAVVVPAPSLVPPSASRPSPAAVRPVARPAPVVAPVKPAPVVAPAVSPPRALPAPAPAPAKAKRSVEDLLSGRN